MALALMVACAEARGEKPAVIFAVFCSGEALCIFRGYRMGHADYSLSPQVSPAR
jgi:hypothetical protein